MIWIMLAKLLEVKLRSLAALSFFFFGWVELLIFIVMSVEYSKIVYRE